MYVGSRDFNLFHINITTEPNYIYSKLDLICCNKNLTPRPNLYTVYCHEVSNNCRLPLPVGSVTIFNITHSAYKRGEAAT